MSFNLLDVSTNFINFAVDKIGMNNLNWIGKIIQWLIEGVGIIGVGVIIFTLILKTVTLPLDVYSRIKMKKQSLVMKSMRPQMEKLQKQYANDKAMYSQKVMELQKQNGVSMFGACLPMIVTLIIFFFVFGAFSTYSQFANGSTYNNMVDEYNASVNKYVLYDYQENTVKESGFLLEYLDETLIDNSKIDLDLSKLDLKSLDLDNLDIDLNLYYTGSQNLDKLKDKKKASLKASLEAQLKAAILSARVYRVDFDAFLKVCPTDNFSDMKEAEKMNVVRTFVKENARRASADNYRDNRNNFLWVNNIWYPDNPLNREVPNFKDFSSAISRATGSALDTSYESSYDEVTHYLRNAGYENANGKIEGNKVNGYFVLIILAIGLMFLQQFISMRSQKDANELGTVDGAGAKQNKWMLIMMPVIYGFFSLMYSAAFSLYMITSTVYGLITTVIINKAMDVSFAKQEANGGYNAKRHGQKNNRKRLK